MKNIILVSTFVTASLLLASNVLADSGSGGKFVAKARLQGILSSAKSGGAQTLNFTSFDGTNSNYLVPQNSGIGNSLGFEIAGNYFFTDNVAIEASVGMFTKKFKTNGTGPQIGVNAATSAPMLIPSTTYNQSSTATFYPLNAILQYHIAPYGKVSPYLGVGYNFTPVNPQGGTKVSAVHGTILQAGIDGWIDDNTLVNIDFKKVLTRAKLVYYNTSPGVSNVMPINTSISMNPMILSVGLGYRF